MSIACSLLNKGSTVWYKLFDLDKALENKSEGFKKLLKLAGHHTDPQLYDESYKKLEAKKGGERVLKWMRDFSTSTTQQISLLLGIGQIIAFLIATTLLVVGLLLI